MELSYVNPGNSVQKSAVQALGWDEGLAVTLDVFGARLVVVAAVDEAEAGRRQAEDLAPVTDSRVLKLHIDLDSAFLTRPAPVRIRGALAIRRTWPSARIAAGIFTAFGPRAVVIPPKQVRPSALAEAAVTGLGIVKWEGSATLVAPAGESNVTRRTYVHRLVEERVWQALTGS